MLSELFMFWTMTKSGVAKTEVDNDDFLATAPTQADLDMLTALLKA